MLPIRFQIIGNLMVIALATVLVGLALGPLQPSPVEQAPARFTTHADMLAVSIRLHRQAAPEILAVQPLAAGRISVLPEGEYSLTVLDAHGEARFKLPFRAIFMLPGSPPRPADTIDLILVAPGGAEARWLRLTGPEGSADWDLQTSGGGDGTD